MVVEVGGSWSWSVVRREPMRRAVLVVGAIAIIVTSFLATDYLITWWLTPLTPDQQRASHAKAIKAAVESYRSTKGQYPAPFKDNPLSDLRKELAEFLPYIPRDPTEPDRPYRYASFDGKTYGLLFNLERGGNCITGKGVAASGWWQNAPPCPF
jgi:hypothetical protein